MWELRDRQLLQTQSQTLMCDLQGLRFVFLFSPTCLLLGLLAQLTPQVCAGAWVLYLC